MPAVMLCWCPGGSWGWGLTTRKYGEVYQQTGIDELANNEGEAAGDILRTAPMVTIAKDLINSRRVRLTGFG